MMPKMTTRRAVFLLLLLFMVPTRANANGYEQAGIAYFQGTQALERKDYFAALSKFNRSLELNPSYGYAAVAAYQMANALEGGAKASLKGFVPFDKAGALTLLQYSLSLAPNVDYGFVDRATESDKEIEAAYLRLSGQKKLPPIDRWRTPPLSLTELKEIVVRHRQPSFDLSHSQFREAIETLQISSPYDAQLGIDRIALKASELSPADRLALFDSVCSMKHCPTDVQVLEALKQDIPKLAQGVETVFEGYLFEPGPARQAAAAFFLAKANHSQTLERLMVLYERSLSADNFRDTPPPLEMAFTAFEPKAVLDRLEGLLRKWGKAEAEQKSEDNGNDYRYRRVRDNIHWAEQIREVSHAMILLRAPGRSRLAALSLDAAAPLSIRVAALNELCLKPTLEELLRLRPLTRDSAPEVSFAFLKYVNEVKAPEAVDVSREAFEKGTAEMKEKALAGVDPRKSNNPKQLLPFFEGVLRTNNPPVTQALHRQALRHLQSIPSLEALLLTVRYQANSEDELSD